MMADLARIKRNVAKMASMNAPEADIDGYIASEGVTIDDVRNFRPSPAPIAAVAEPQPAPVAQEGEPITGLWENIGAGFDNGVNSLLGAPVDLPVFLGNSLINATNSGIEMTGNGRPVPNIPVDLPGSRLGWEETQGKLGFTTPSMVEPADEGQKLARAATESAVMAAVPEAMMVKAGQVVAQLPRSLQVAHESLEALLGNSQTAGQFARNATVNAAGGAGTQAAADAAPEGWEPVAALVGGVAAGGLVHSAGDVAAGATKAVTDVAGDYVAPLTQSGRERLAGKTIQDAATDKAALMASLAEPPMPNIEGSQPTTFQLSGDMGIGAIERGAAARNPAEFMQRRADQNAAQVAAMEGLQSTGAPEAVSNAVRAQLEQIDTDTFARVDSAMKAAQQTAAAVGRGQTPEVSGQAIRETLESARAAAKEREAALWAAVDPDGSLALSPAQTKVSAAQIVEQTPASARQAGGEEKAIFDVVGKYGDTIPLRELSALHSRIKDELRQLRTIGAGESAGYRRLTQLNNSVFADLNEAVVARVVQEQDAVAKGLMQHQDTLEAMLQRQAEAFLADRRETAAGQGGGAGTVISRPVGPSASARVSRTAGQGQFGPGGTARDPRLSGDGLEPNFDEAALDRLNTAREATQDRVNVYDNNLLRPIRQRPSTQSPYDMTAASVPGRIFHAGAKSFDDVRNYRNAVGDQVAMRQLQAYAVDRMRSAALRDDGTIDPRKLATWRRQHADALRAFPALDKRLDDVVRASERFDGAQASRKVTLDDAQKGVVGRLLGLDDPNDVVRTIGGIFSRQDSAAQMQRLVQMIGDDPEAREGLRKSIVEYVAGRFIGNTEAATSGLGTIKSDGYQTFFRGNTNALRLAGFNDDELEMMARIAKDLQQTNRSIASVKLPGGSNTTQDVLAAKANDSGQTILGKAILGATATGGLASWIGGGPIVGGAAAAGTLILSAFRQAGLQKVDDLVKEAMLNPPLARMLLLKASPGNEKLVSSSLPQVLSRIALLSQTQAQRD